jgi:hypothetical protein
LFAILGNVTKVLFRETTYSKWFVVYQEERYTTTVFVGDGITAQLEQGD